jgi:CRISPR-associated protein Csb2
MSLVVTAHFPLGRYDAASATDARRAEYPPSVARLFCALRDVADDDELPVLDALEMLLAPQIWAPENPVAAEHRDGFVVTNDIEAKGSSQFHPGRSNASKTRAGTVLADPVVRFIWPVADFAEVEVLNRMLGRVHYLGRSTSVVRLDAAVAEVIDPSRRCFRPAVTGTVRVRVPYPGYRRDLEDTYAAGGSAWMVPAREQRYVYGGPEDAAPVARARSVVSSVFDDVVVWRLDARPGMLSAQDVFGLTTLLRRAVHRCVWHSLGCGERWPDVVTDEVAEAAGIHPAISGHRRDGRHLAFVALPDVGHAYAEGRPLGVAVLLPRLDDAAERKRLRQQLFRAISAEPGLTCLFPWRNTKELRLQRVELSASGVPRALQPQRWGAPSRFWATATPYVVDRFVKRGDLRDAFALSCELAGLPVPRTVAVHRTPFVEGAVTLRAGDIAWGNRRRQPMYHVAAEFDDELTGPVLVGALRYLGLGLMTPMDRDDFRRRMSEDQDREREAR